MCERQPCIAESLFQGRGVRVQGCEEGGEGPPAPFWVAGPLSVGCESAISMGAPIAEALALVLTNLCLLICDRRVEEVAHRSTETGGTSAGRQETGRRGCVRKHRGALPADNYLKTGTNHRTQTHGDQRTKQGKKSLVALQRAASGGQTFALWDAKPKDSDA